MTILLTETPHQPPTADGPVIRKGVGPWHTFDATIKRPSAGNSAVAIK
jgi:hypothetical protein